MENSEKFITKMNGDRVFFDSGKLHNSLERSGAGEPVIQQIIRKVESALYEGITTKKIYKLAYRLLRESSRPSAARYKLKKAIMELGPTGFPFEKYIAEIFKHEGFSTKVGVVVKGHCVNHEVDVIAERNHEKRIVECKYHSLEGRKSDIKTSLYFQSRFLDITKELQKSDKQKIGIYEGWISTNTRFTSDAIKYGNCVGLNLLGWDYPEKGSLKERIDGSGLYPVTCLTTLTNREKEKLLSKEVVLCSEISKHPDVLKLATLVEKRRENVLKEVRELCMI